jgi:hypothetical protein
MFTKHSPPLAAIIPFGDDPYDAIGSFCMIVSALLALLSLVRAFRPYGAGLPTPLRETFLARTQIAVPLGVLVTLGADGIAMARHLPQWAGKAATGELLALEAGLATLTIAVLILVRRSILPAQSSVSAREWRRALIAVLISAAILAFFPEDVIQSVTLHFMAIILGFVLIAAPQAALAVALVPGEAFLDPPAEAKHGRRFSRWIRWGAAALLGIAIGTAALATEIFGDAAGNAPLNRVLLVSAVYLGAGMGVILVGLAFLGKPLGLIQSSSAR